MPLLCVGKQRARSEIAHSCRFVSHSRQSLAPAATCKRGFIFRAKVFGPSLFNTPGLDALDALDVCPDKQQEARRAEGGVSRQGGRSLFTADSNKESSLVELISAKPPHWRPVGTSFSRGLHHGASRKQVCRSRRWSPGGAASTAEPPHSLLEFLSLTANTLHRLSTFYHTCSSSLPACTKLHDDIVQAFRSL